MSNAIWDSYSGTQPVVAPVQTPTPEPTVEEPATEEENPIVRNETYSS